MLTRKLQKVATEAENKKKMIPMYFHYLNPLPPGNTALPSSLYQKDEDPPEHS